MNKNEIIVLINLLQETENQIPDDQWDENHWKGFKAGIIESINFLTHSSFNYNINAKDIWENLKRRF